MILCKLYLPQVLILPNNTIGMMLFECSKAPESKSFKLKINHTVLPLCLVLPTETEKGIQDQIPKETNKRERKSR